MKKTLLFIAFSGIFWFHASANNIRVTGIQIAGQDTLQNTIAVNFNLSWENSWRLSTAPVNWDAAWVFIKYRLKGAGSWQHAKLSGQGHTPGSRAALELGLQNQDAPFDPSNNPALGVFIYPDSAHEGTFTANGVSLKWDYGASGVPDNAGEVEIRVFAIEMVLVPDGNFHLGSGGAETNRFHSGGDPNSSFLVMGEQEISIGTGLGQLYYTSDTDYAGDRQGPIPAAFPKGFRGFYSMKYEISQQQYADFLNTLNEQQLSNRLIPQDFNTSISGYAFELQRTDTGFVAQRPNSACNFISVEDALAYSDWSGLRPMSEMEFEKAARGPLAPVPNEFAWGDTTLAMEVYSFSNFGKSDEQISSNYQTQSGNAAYSNTTFSEEFRPPYRVGIFAGNAQNSGRRSSGSGYWGVMELSGGLYEVCVTIGSPAGRQFTGQHGDGAIDSLGRHNVADWSGDATMMYSLRGGTFSLDSTVMRTSDRSFGGRLLFQPSLKRANRGFRAVRSAGVNLWVTVMPTVFTLPITSITATSATSGGFVASDGGAAVTARGVVWGHTPGPSIDLNTKTIDGTGTGSFTSQLTGLAPNALYFVRAYATNSEGTAYGPNAVFTTSPSLPDSSASIRCGAYIAPGEWKEFMCYNLGSAYTGNDSARLFTPSWEINGGYWQWGRKEMAAPGPSGPSAPNSGSISGWNTTDAANGSWSDVFKTANDPCPAGYRVPTRAQWAGVISNNVVSNIGSSWSPSSTNYSTGKRFGDRLFLPAAGNRGDTYGSLNGNLNGRGVSGSYWSSSEGSSDSGYSWLMNFDSSDFSAFSHFRRDGLSLRCIKEDPVTGATLPSLTTDTIASITTIGAAGGGSVTSEGGTAVTSRGVVWSTSPSPTIELSSKTSDGFGIGTFTSQLSGLAPNTTYVVRAYATNSAGTAYGNEQTFRTLESVPDTASSFTCGAYIAPGEWKEFMCYNLGSAYTGNDSARLFSPSWEINGGYWQWGRKEMAAPGPSGPSAPNSGSISGWKPFVAPNGSWSDAVKTTNDPCPAGYRVPTRAQWAGVISNNAISNAGSSWISSSTNYSTGKHFGDRLFLPAAGIRDLYRGPVYQRGSVGNYCSSSEDSLSSGPDGYIFGVLRFSIETADAPYYGLRSWLALSLRCIKEGPATGVVLPSVTTDSITSITTTGAAGGGTITSDGGAPITARGVVWSTSPNPTVALSTRTSDGMGTGSFTSQLSGLAPNTTYYISAYATNSAGTAYGSQVVFMTIGSVPDTASSFTCGAYIAPGVWKEFMCHNLGSANPDANPFTPSWEINGGYWQWGRKEMAAAGPSGLGAGQANDGTIAGWNTTGAIDGSWSYAVKTANDPCPAGFRVPTTAQWQGVVTNNEMSRVGSSWMEGSTNYTTGLKIGDSLFLPAAGYRDNDDGSLFYRGLFGAYWSSSSTYRAGEDLFLLFNDTDLGIEESVPGEAFSIRCIAEDNATFVALPWIRTDERPRNLTATSALVDSYVVYDGDAAVTARGVVWSTSSDPTIALSTKTSDGSGKGGFISELSGLTPNTTYYVRAYATNSLGTGYGNEFYFQTRFPTTPIVYTSRISNIGAISATGGGAVDFDGYAEVTARGVVWSTSPNPTIALSTKTSDGTGTGSFTSQISGLTPNTTYYVRAYATNSVGTDYGSEVSFKTSVLNYPSVTTEEITFTEGAVLSGGTVTSDGGAPVNVRGIVWSTASNPTTALATKTSDGSGTGAFTSTIPGLQLQPNIRYYVRAYAVNSLGTAYGEEYSFVIEPPSIILVYPFVSTNPVSSISFNSAVSGGHVAIGNDVTARGVVWSTAMMPTIDLPTKTNNGTGLGPFTSTMTGLKAGTRYYARAYATNYVGTSYGEERGFKTMDTLPTVRTLPVTDIDKSSAISGGEVIFDGGAIVTARGVVWDTLPNPTVKSPLVFSSPWTIDGTGIGTFTSSVTRLGSCKTYYLRAYATNAVGTSYGEEVIFKTLGPPDLRTVAISNAQGTSATTGGNITDDCGAAVTARGVVWSTTPDPTVASATSVGNITSNGTGKGSFTSQLTGLLPNTQYYVRAYATNSVGTAYGDGISFTTTVSNCGAYIAPGVWKEFMCHNLGAANPDADPFTPSWEINGGYWQWGRAGMAAPGPSGPSAPNSGSISGWNTTDAPNGSWSDAVKTANDPCPSGYRVPTRAQWAGVISNNAISNAGSFWISSSTNYSTGKRFGDRLFLPAAGNRIGNDGSLGFRGFSGDYWSSSENSSFGDSFFLGFFSSGVGMYSSGIRRYGLSLRCITE
jgi:uncharacterized protein (TIGR02145 family)